MHQLATPPWSPLAEVAVGAHRVHRRCPGLEQRRAEGEDVVGRLDVIDRGRSHALGQKDRQRRRFLPPVHHDVVGRAEGAQEALADALTQATTAAPQERERLGAADLPQQP